MKKEFRKFEHMGRKCYTQLKKVYGGEGGI